MKTENSHLIYYLLVGLILVGGVGLVFAYSPDKQMQMLIVMGLSLLYFLVGIFHHLINHDLVAKIVIEYVLIAALGIAGAFFVFRGGFGF